jgi:hypothetical protein
MKTIKYPFAIILFLTMQFSACTETNDGTYVAPISISEKIQGNWAAISVNQIDEVAKAIDKTTSPLYLTTQFNFSTFNITFNVDATTNLPTTYQISGSSPALFPTQGYWNLANLYSNTDTTPSQIILYSDAEKTVKTATLDITTMPGAIKTLELRFTRKTKGVAFVSYTFKLSPTN